MPYQADPEDVFGETPKTPSLSWKNLPIGSVFVLEVTEPAKMLQSRNFDTNQPDYWDKEQKQPVMSGVINVRVISGPHSVQELRSVWAQKPSNLFQAISEAQKAAGSRIAPGGILSLRLEGEVPHKDAKKNAVKQYVARYQPPADGFYEAPPTPQTQYAQPAQTAQPARTASPVPLQQTAVRAGWGSGAPTPAAKATW